jgi:hypothetical protein
MVGDLPPPATVAKDARRRAWRTFAWGLLTDVGFALATVLLAATADLRITREYGLALAILVTKTVVTSGLTYIMRFLKPPPGT